MRFFLHTANLDELKKGASWGVVDGVTTNPTLIAKENTTTEEQSPFIGRLDDIGGEGMNLIRDIVTIYKNCGFATQVLSASLRSPRPVIESAKAGAHIGTNHPLTDNSKVARETAVPPR